MATATAFLFSALLVLASVGAGNVEAQVGHGDINLMAADGTEWPTAAAAAYSYPFGPESDEGVEEEQGGGGGRVQRSLFWWQHRGRYYISYGALSANRVPCPPRSGRSYYTHNCYRARGPACPYTRGCSAISRCRR